MFSNAAAGIMGGRIKKRKGKKKNVIRARPRNVVMRGQ